MSDYTPTTEEVRHIYGNYLDDNVLKWGEAMAGEARKRFDRWLASVKAEAWDEGHLSFYEAGVICPNPYREVRLRRHGVSTSRRNTEKETDD